MLSEVATQQEWAVVSVGDKSFALFFVDNLKTNLGHILVIVKDASSKLLKI